VAKKFYDYFLRAGDVIENVAWYIWLNPVRKAMVVKPQDYLFAGSFTGLQMPQVWNIDCWQPPWKKAPQNLALR
jgi:hypothetical protein